MSGFSVGDVFGKTFLSAETIIGGRSTKKVFNATMTGLSVDGTSVPNTGFKQIISGEDFNGKAAGPNGWAFKSIKSVHNKNKKTGKLTSSEAAEFFKSYSGEDTGDDRMILYQKDAFHFKPAVGTTAKFKFRYVTNKTSSNSKQSSPYDYVVNIKRGGNSGGASIPTAAQSNSYPTITGYNYVRATSQASGYVDFTMEFDGDRSNDYWSIDMDKNWQGVGTGIGQSTFVSGGKQFTRLGGKAPYDEDIDRVEITLLSITKNPVSGCTDTSASNYDSNATNDDDSCVYTLATIKSFTRSPTGTVKPGDMVKFSYELNSLGDLPSRKGFSKVELLLDGNVIKDFGRSVGGDYTTAIPKEGNLNYELRVLWDKVSDAEDASLSVNSVAPQSLVACEDPNASKYGETSATGDCGSCNSGYARDSSGTCKKQGCMTQDDYSYDSTAEIHVESMCSGTPETGGGGTGNGGTGGTGGDNGGGATDGGGTDGGQPYDLPESPETDETGDAISSQIEPETPGLGRFVLPGIGVAALLVILMR